MHPDCARHDTGWAHPEHQGRLPAIVDAVYRDTPALIDVMLQREGAHANVADVARVHQPAMIEIVRDAAQHAREAGRVVLLDPDTVVSSASWDAALAAAGCAIEGARLVLSGGSRSAFVLTRPPGHHATPSRSMGFCLFNNVAVATRWAQAEHRVGRVLILDWDVHHGNGTQDVFYEDPSVYFVSLHLEGHYPGTGHAHERGAGAGTGTTRNVPLAEGTPGRHFRAAFTQALEATLEEFTPELVFISAGFDCLTGDPLGGLAVEPADLHALAGQIVESCQCGVVALLEGGYAPERVGQGVLNVLRGLSGLAAA
jgi:acetoin utilization deacetylase AcuC-like enzyme